MTLAELGHSDRWVMPRGSKPICPGDYCRRCGECLAHALEQQARCSSPLTPDGPENNSVPYAEWARTPGG